LFWLASALLPGFDVAGFGSALVGAILYGVIAWALSALIPNSKG
jgi:putative membrane protein